MSIHPHSPLVIGDEFGTRSGRTVVVRVADGAELGSAITVYPHAVVDRRLQAAGALPPEWTLQAPSDLAGVLRTTVPAAMCTAGAHAAYGAAADRLSEHAGRIRRWAPLEPGATGGAEGCPTAGETHPQSDRRERL